MLQDRLPCCSLDNRCDTAYDYDDDDPAAILNACTRISWIQRRICFGDFLCLAATKQRPATLRAMLTCPWIMQRCRPNLDRAVKAAARYATREDMKVLHELFQYIQSQNLGIEKCQGKSA